MFININKNIQSGDRQGNLPVFRAVSVFDISQTDGEPLPELEVKEFLSMVEGI